MADAVQCSVYEGCITNELLGLRSKLGDTAPLHECAIIVCKSPLSLSLFAEDYGAINYMLCCKGFRMAAPNVAPKYLFWKILHQILR
jgi:hypothetical protein